MPSPLDNLRIAERAIAMARSRGIMVPVIEVIERAPPYALAVEDYETGRIGYPQVLFDLLTEREQECVALHEVVHLGQGEKLIEAQQKAGLAGVYFKAVKRAKKGKSDEDPAQLRTQAEAYAREAIQLLDECEIEANRAEIQEFGFDTYYSAAMKMIRAQHPQHHRMGDLTLLTTLSEENRQEVGKAPLERRCLLHKGGGADLSLPEIVLMLAKEQGVVIHD